MQILALHNNKIGDAGVTALADACTRGSLAQLKELWLNHNQIGDPGVTALASACAGGSLASLETLVVDDGPLGVDHPQLKAVCEQRGIYVR